MSEWISVKERRPKPRIRVLVWFRFGRNSQVEISWILERSCGFPSVWMGGNGAIDNAENENRITHWMPLPSEPKDTP